MQPFVRRGEDANGHASWSATRASSFVGEILSSLVCLYTPRTKQAMQARARKSGRHEFGEARRRPSGTAHAGTARGRIVLWVTDPDRVHSRSFDPIDRDGRQMTDGG